MIGVLYTGLDVGWPFLVIGTILFLLNLIRFDLCEKYLPFLTKWGFGYAASKWSCVYGCFVMILFGIFDLYYREKLGLFGYYLDKLDHYVGDYLTPIIVTTGFALAAMDFYRHRQSLSIEEIENP